jgi:hypothetical protein
MVVSYIALRHIELYFIMLPFLFLQCIKCLYLLCFRDCFSGVSSEESTWNQLIYISVYLLHVHLSRLLFLTSHFCFFFSGLFSTSYYRHRSLSWFIFCWIVLYLCSSRYNDFQIQPQTAFPLVDRYVHNLFCFCCFYCCW